jgi:hypothetical protein
MAFKEDTNYAQETFESPIYWIAFLQDLSYYLTYTVFGDVYVGANDWSTLHCIADPLELCGSFPGPGTFDN